MSFWRQPTQLFPKSVVTTCCDTMDRLCQGHKKQNKHVSSVGIHHWMSGTNSSLFSTLYNLEQIRKRNVRSCRICTLTICYIALIFNLCKIKIFVIFKFEISIMYFPKEQEEALTLQIITDWIKKTESKTHLLISYSLPSEDYILHYSKLQKMRKNITFRRL